MKRETGNLKFLGALIGYINFLFSINFLSDSVYWGAVSINCCFQTYIIANSWLFKLWSTIVMWPCEWQLMFSTGINLYLLAPLTLDLNQKHFNKFIVNSHDIDEFPLLVWKLLLCTICLTLFSDLVQFRLQSSTSMMNLPGWKVLAYSQSWLVLVYSIGTSKSSISSKIS